MTSYRVAVTNSWVQSAPSVRGLATLLGVTAPFGLRALLDRLQAAESVVVESDINTDDDAPINGHVRFELHSDGSYVFSGHMRATGFPSYHYGLQAWVTTADGTVIAAQRVGDVYGTDTPGSRQDDWTQPGTNRGIALHWRSLRDGPSIGYRMDAAMGGVLGAARDVLEFALKGLGTNLVLGGAGWIVLIGTELADMHVRIGTPDVLAGILVAGGTLLIVGPFGVVPAITAGAATAALIDVRHRAMSPEERTFADRVFNGTVDFDRVTLTNMSHDGRKFTIPSIDDSILVNLDDAFDHPMTYQESVDSDYPEPGSVFIHELTHAWQITNNSFVGVICGMSSDYDYAAGSSRTADAPWARRSWDGFNNEQQAHIVDDWYGLNVVRDDQGGYMIDAWGVPFTDLEGFAATNDPAYRFIRDNIRTRAAY